MHPVAPAKALRCARQLPWERVASSRVAVLVQHAAAKAAPLPLRPALTGAVAGAVAGALAKLLHPAHNSPRHLRGLRYRLRRAPVQPRRALPPPKAKPLPREFRAGRSVQRWETAQQGAPAAWPLVVQGLPRAPRSPPRSVAPTAPAPPPVRSGGKARRPPGVVRAGCGYPSAGSPVPPAANRHHSPRSAGHRPAPSRDRPGLR